MATTLFAPMTESNDELRSFFYESNDPSDWEAFGSSFVVPDRLGDSRAAALRTSEPDYDLHLQLSASTCQRPFGGEPRVPEFCGVLPEREDGCDPRFFSKRVDFIMRYGGPEFGNFAYPRA